MRRPPISIMSLPSQLMCPPLVAESSNETTTITMWTISLNSGEPAPDLVMYQFPNRWRLHWFLVDNSSGVSCWWVSNFHRWHSIEDDDDPPLETPIRRVTRGTVMIFKPNPKYTLAITAFDVVILRSPKFALTIPNGSRWWRKNLEHYKKMRDGC